MASTAEAYLVAASGAAGLPSATAVASSTQYSTDKNSNNHHVREEEECTALTFAKSAPHSGYLKKLGKNISRSNFEVLKIEIRFSVKSIYIK